MDPPGLTVLICNFGAGVNATSGLSVYTRYLLLIFSLKCSSMTEGCCKLNICTLQEL